MKYQYDTKFHIIVLKLITAQNYGIQPNPATANEQMKFLSFLAKVANVYIRKQKKTYFFSAGSSPV